MSQDRKSVLLSILVLTVCALAVVNASSAAARARRTELGVLACLGWNHRRLMTLLLIQPALDYEQVAHRSGVAPLDRVAGKDNPGKRRTWTLDVQQRQYRNSDVL